MEEEETAGITTTPVAPKRIKLQEKVKAYDVSE